MAEDCRSTLAAGVMDDDGYDKDDTKRRSRNLSEKKRRDQFNFLVNELSSMITTNSRKMDKSSILKAAITFLKSNNELAVRSKVDDIQEDWKPSFLSNEEFTHLILEALNGFIMVISSTGRIFYASESITSLLGHLPNEIVNTSIFDITFNDDRPHLYNALQNINDCDNLMHDNADNQIVFNCHLKRGCLDFREEPTFELVQFNGYFRSNVNSQEIDDISPGSNFKTSFSENDTSLLFICTGRLTTPQLIREMSVIDSEKGEFTSRHSLEWKFLYLDHRAPPIIGYLPFEVLGTSGYDYYHFDDLDKVVKCHKALMQKGEGTSCFYRFLTKGQQWIWLQTRFYITYHQWNSKPEFVVCTHRVLSYIDIIKHLQRDNMTCDQDSCINKLTELEQKLMTNSSSPPMEQQNNNTVQRGSWSKVSSRASRFSITPEPTTRNESYRRHSSTIHSSGPGSDTGSLSADSITSRQSSQHSSNLTHEREPKSFLFKRSRLRHSDKHSSSHTPYLSVTQPSHLQNHRSSHCQTNHQQQANLIVHRPIHSQSVQYLESPQYVAVPVQPVLGFSQLQALPPSPDVGILITPVQAQMQEQLQKKHEELQQMIIHQQEELRRVSEQLVMARYGLLPPIINVSVPYNVQGGSSGETADLYHHGLLPAGSQRAIIDQSIQQIIDPNEYIPMQMSQQQAQLLFSSPNQNQNIDRQM